MKKFLMIAILAITAGGIFWQYLAVLVREKSAAFAGAVFAGDTEEMKRIVSDVVIFENNSERRKVLLGDLEKNFTTIKKYVSENKKSIVLNGVAEDVFDKAIDSSEKVIEDLKGVNSDSGIVGEVEKRILDRVLPTISPPVCPAPQS